MVKCASDTFILIQYYGILLLINVAMQDIYIDSCRGIFFGLGTFLSSTHFLPTFLYSFTILTQ